MTTTLEFDVDHCCINIAMEARDSWHMTLFLSDIMCTGHFGFEFNDDKQTKIFILSKNVIFGINSKKFLLN